MTRLWLSNPSGRRTSRKILASKKKRWCVFLVGNWVTHHDLSQSLVPDMASWWFPQIPFKSWATRSYLLSARLLEFERFGRFPNIDFKVTKMEGSNDPGGNMFVKSWSKDSTNQGKQLQATPLSWRPMLVLQESTIPNHRELLAPRSKPCKSEWRRCKGSWPEAWKHRDETNALKPKIA